MADSILHRITFNQNWQRENCDDLVKKYLNMYKQHHPDATYDTLDSRIKESNPDVNWENLVSGQPINIPMDVPAETPAGTEPQQSNPTESTTTTTPTEEAQPEEQSSGKPNKAGLYIVCNGAECKCDQSKEKIPALLEVISHNQVYVNDKDSAEKLVATTNDLPLPFEKKANTFGTCKKQPIGGGQYKPCIPNVTSWDKSYEAIKIAPAGNGTALIEESEGICSFGGKITFTTHGQTETVTAADVAQTPPEVAEMLSDGILTEEEVQKLAGSFDDETSTAEILDINTIGNLTPVGEKTGTYSIHTSHKELIFKVCVSKPKTLTAEQEKTINWAVYIKKKNNTFYHHHTFIDLGKKFTFPYRTPNIYAIEAYTDQPKFDLVTGKGGAFNLLEIANQKIAGLALSANGEKRDNNLVRTTEVVTITAQNKYTTDALPLTEKDLFWEVTNSKGAVKSCTKAGNTLIIPPQPLGKITVTAYKGSSQTATLTYKVINNSVVAITSDVDEVSVLNQGETEKERHKVILKVSEFKINPPTPDELALVKWTSFGEKEDPNKNKIIATGEKITRIFKSEGTLYYEAFMNEPAGKDKPSAKKITAIQPKITKAYWANKDGNPIDKSGFKHQVYICVHSQGLKGEKIQLNVWEAESGKDDFIKNANKEFTLQRNRDSVLTVPYTLPEDFTSKLEYGQCEFFFTIKKLDLKVEGTAKDPECNNEYVLVPNKNVHYLFVKKEQKIVSLKIYEKGDKLHTGIVKYGDTVTIKIETRNYIGKELTFEIWKDVKVDNHTDGYSTYDTMDDEKFSETIKVKIDAEGNGKTNFTIPETWKNKQNGKTMQLFYLKEKESGDEFPQSYYIANPNTSKETQKKNSNRIIALMLKVSDSLKLDDFMETNSAVILGEELQNIHTIEGKCYCQGGLTIELFNKIFGSKILFSAVNMKNRTNVYKLKTQKLVDAINAVMKKYDINTCLRLSHFLAQIEHESDHFNTTEEYASGSAYEGRADLGNTQEGDGKRFKGRGLIQLTGRTNYTNYTNYVKKEFKETRNFTKEPDNDIIASEIKYAVDAAGWYWKFGSSHGNINDIADKDDVTKVTKAVNGGKRGLADRQAKTENAKKVLNQKHCKVQKTGTVKKGYDIDKAVNYINANAESGSVGKCALYVRKAINAGGISGSWGDAWQYITALPTIGFTDLGNITDFKKGDIVVFNKTGDRKYGHIAMWTGSQWVSDFKQRSIIVHSDYNGKNYHVFRWQ